MPANILLHEGDPFAFNSTGNDRSGFLAGYRRQIVQSVNDLAYIVAVYLNHIPVKSTPFVGIWFETHILGVKTGHQLLVSVNNTYQIAQFIRSGGISGLLRWLCITATGTDPLKGTLPVTIW